MAISCTSMRSASAGRDLLAGADESFPAQLGDAGLFHRRVGIRSGGLGRLERREDAAVAQQAEAGARGEVVLRLFLGAGGERPHAQSRMRHGMARAR